MRWSVDYLHFIFKSYLCFDIINMKGVNLYENSIYRSDHEVTGSCTLLEVCGKKYLVDCGMDQ